MFSWEFLRKSLELARRVLANQRTSTRALLKQSEGSNPLPVAASLSRSSFGGSNNGDRKSGDALLKFLLRSVASGVVIVGSSLSFSYRYPSLVDKCSFVSFADSADDAAWVSSEDLLPHKKKKRFHFGAYEQGIIQTFSIPGIGYSFVSFLSIVPDSYRRRVFFNYEKRIRLQSPPEKVFEYFASKKPDGEVLMTPADLMRAVVPVFPPSESNRVREGFLRGETVPGELHCAPSRFFMLFDTNSDGLISFSEY
ncbi:hypothetical protein NC651_038994 [Populus alba x Populus x berolinensis]|nr:hypothetical protein NC651_038994 [Populus alba x Populus x berolinensis]